MDSTERIKKRIKTITGELSLIEQGTRSARGRRIRRLIAEAVDLSQRLPARESRLLDDLKYIMGNA